MDQPVATVKPQNIREEHLRLEQARGEDHPWRLWGPYLSERAWGTVREDYSRDGDAWSYLPHDHARSKAYRWGEDGIAGWSDRQQRLCFALALWNGQDPILKERFFGLTGPQGNHGEDVKEIYHYLDATPTASLATMNYKYPQRAYPYEELVITSQQRDRHDREYEIQDTGIFDDSRYFEVVVRYAKATATTTYVDIELTNRGPDPATLHVLPQVWLRNDWSWFGECKCVRKIESVSLEHVSRAVKISHDDLPDYFVLAQDHPKLLFTHNHTNQQRLYGKPNAPSPYVKDAFDRYLVHGETAAVNPDPSGTKAGFLWQLQLKSGQSKRVRLIITDDPGSQSFSQIDAVLKQRQDEADAFYQQIHRPQLTAEECKVQRQALAGLIWTQQFYMLDMQAWLKGDDPKVMPPPERDEPRNEAWGQLSVADVMSMPDTWEYPWFAAWDLAFHTIPMAMIDVDAAKGQLELIVNEKLLHPNGQVPAYEWAFSDVNPPVQAWAVWRVYNMDKHANKERGDLAFLERCYHKLLLNFTWWVNRKDSRDRNVFQGGFLGLDNISVFDRSKPLPDGSHLEQADATGWMGLYSLNMLSISLELAQHNRSYENLAIKFLEHFMAISTAINCSIDQSLSLWDRKDGWYYDLAHGLGDDPHKATPIAVRSQVGLVPLFAAMVLKHSWFENLPAFKRRYEWLITHRPDLAGGLSCVWTPSGTQCLLSIVNHDRMHRIFDRMLDEDEFLSPFGIRALSKYHEKHPYTLSLGDQHWTVNYEPGESTTDLFGGNSNWRGPIWMPTNYMIITALRVYDRFYGDQFKVECPTGSGNMLTLNQVALHLAQRLAGLLLPDDQGKRPGIDWGETLQSDPHMAQHLLFHEYFHGDTGRGLGASHQTGWTALIAKMLDQIARGRDAHDI